MWLSGLPATRARIPLGSSVSRGLMRPNGRLPAESVANSGIPATAPVQVAPRSVDMRRHRLSYVEDRLTVIRSPSAFRAIAVSEYPRVDEPWAMTLRNVQLCPASVLRISSADWPAPLRLAYPAISSGPFGTWMTE